MKKRKVPTCACCFLLAFILCLGTIQFWAVPVEAATATIKYQAHCQDIGWMSTVSNGATAGTTGQSRQLEALKISLSGISGGVTYQAHVSNIGWQSWVSNNAIAGTTGRSLQMEAIKIKLTGTAADTYDVFYRVHMEDLGWGPWTSNGAVAGTTGQNRQIEAIQIVLKTKGSTSNYSMNMNEFIKDSRWCHLASYGSSQKPKCSKVTWSCSGCAAYCADFVYQVYGLTSVYYGTQFTKASEIRSGDVIKVTGSQHWIVVLERNGNKLYTAEGNWTVSGKSGVVRISDSTYTINSAGQLCSGGSVFRTWSCGYHFS